MDSLLPWWWSLQVSLKRRYFLPNCISYRGRHQSFLPVQKLVFLTHALKTYRGSGGTAPHILNMGTKWKWVVSLTPRPFQPQERTPVIELESGCAPEPVWVVLEKRKYLVPTGIWNSGRPVAPPYWLYRLHYCVSLFVMVRLKDLNR